MRQNYFKNAALLTGSDVVLRLAGMGLRIWLANELGGEGMGLYQLVLAVYSLFVTLATAGVSVAATRLMAEELSGPASAHGAARGMLRRLLAVSMRKNLSLSQRIFCTTPKTVRGRLLTYFSAQAARCGRMEFEVPFNRQQMADFLSVDRSALSAELSKMKKEGLIDYHKDKFTLRQEH